MIDKFLNEYYFLSNYYNCNITYNNIRYRSVQSAFQSQKSNDINIQKQFSNLPPNEAKKLGRKIQLRKDWQNVKNDIMYALLKIKFSNDILKNKLIETKDNFLIEGNTWHDNYWGSCYCRRCNNKGNNILGKLLMKLRKELLENYER